MKNNKEIVSRNTECQRRYYKRNRIMICKRRNEDYKTNKEIIKAQQKKYYEKHKESRLKTMKAYREKKSQASINEKVSCKPNADLRDIGENKSKTMEVKK